MTIREKIQEQLQHVSEERLEALYELVKQFTETPSHKPGLLSKLKQIHIEAPVDFAANLDLYTSGEKRVEVIR